MSRELFDAANAVFSGFRGALANATVGACAAFGAICGLDRHRGHLLQGRDPRDAALAGYHDDRRRLVAAAGTLGILIPPSVILAIYSLVAEQSLPSSSPPR